ncbi:MAG: FkbM family methyltransferase [Treponema sp.]|jgi:FkbM family methyltransferase|nr:FkbM family methyltransferase [Treponema sp.]
MIPGIKRLEFLLRNYFSYIKTFGKYTYTSQYSQDRIAYLYVKGKTDGFFIDIGAHDGISANNSFIFEQLGWKGICIEPQQNRKCDLYNGAIYSETLEEMDFIKINDADFLSGLNIVFSDDRKALLEKENHKIEHIKIQAMSFDDMMKKYPSINRIDFMSLDVEGGELAILQNINFEKYKFCLIAIENNEPDGVLEKYMRTKGYMTLLAVGGDILFVEKIYS